MFLIMVNIFLAILNDSYLAVKEIANAEEIEEGPPPPTFRERLRTAIAWLRQHQLQSRIDRLRKEQRLRELAERREVIKKEEARQRVLRGMGIDVEAMNREKERKQVEAKHHLGDAETGERI